MFRNEVVVKSHRRDGDRYILSVCIDETSNCYTLRIRAGNSLSDSAESVINTITSGLSGVEFNNNYEIMGTYNLNGSMHSPRKAPRNNFGERFGDRVCTDNKEWSDPRYGLSFKPRQLQS